MSIDRCTEMLEDSFDKIKGGFDVNIQSQTSPFFQYMLIDEQKTDITLTAPISVDDTVLSLSAGHGFTATTGEYAVVRNGDLYFQLKVVSVLVNDITVEIPVDNAFPLSGTTVIRGNSLMNIDGATSPTEFKFSMTGATIPIDLSGIKVAMFSGASVPDDGKFGGITALSEGVYLRKIDSSTMNLGNYTTNKDFKDVTGVVEYSEKAPAGTNGTTVTIHFENMFGQVLRLDPMDLVSFIAYVRDDLTSLSLMTVALIGSYTRGE